MRIPKYVYHATYKPYLKDIMRFGLGRSEHKNYADSDSSLVYVALEPEVAYSYAEMADFIAELDDEDANDWCDNIVVLKIDTTKLDVDYFDIDPNVQDNEGDTLVYYGIIPREAIIDIVDEEGNSLNI